MTISAAKSEKPVKRIMISSTARDLPEHRDKVKEACLCQEMLPVMMEHLSTSSDDAIKASLKKLPPIEREQHLLSILDREPFLIVLDGLERIMVAYVRMDAARLAHDDLDQKTANVIAEYSVAM